MMNEYSQFRRLAAAFAGLLSVAGCGGGGGTNGTVCCAAAPTPVPAQTTAAAAGSVTLVIPTPAPAICSPSPVSVAVSATTVVKCAAAGYIGTFAATVADPTVANVTRSPGTTDLYLVTGLKAGSTTLSLAFPPTGSGSVVIDVTP